MLEHININKEDVALWLQLVEPCFDMSFKPLFFSFPFLSYPSEKCYLYINTKIDSVNIKKERKIQKQ